MLNQEVILVNAADEPLGTMEKMEAHRRGILHRAFSVFIFTPRGQMLLQQRADNKYHSPGLWTNACCSHPGPGEITDKAASRRLKEELGFTTTLEKVFDFTYRSEYENGLTEHEFDHVYAGIYDGRIEPNRAEVKDVCFQDLSEIASSLEAFPNKYSSWFQLAFPLIHEWASEKFAKHSAAAIQRN
jgi:isopentenyl-diphosphate delta-isomerase